MRIVGINASARQDGLTAAMLTAVLEGAREAGAETDWIALRDLEIERCRMCDDMGWGLCRAEGRCVVDDGLAGVIEKLTRADAFVFATPVYYGDLSESARALTDRMRRVVASKALARKPLHGKPCVCIAAAGGSGGGTASCMVTLEKVFQTCGCFVVDLIPVARRNRHYKERTARLAGRGLAELPADMRPA